MDDVKNNVIFTGIVPFSSMQEIYDSADVFVLPSLREGMPMVVMEAISSGLPVIATKVSGTQEVLDDKCAIFVRRKNSEDISKAVIKILSDNKKAEKMSKESLVVAKRFSREIVLKKYSDLYDAIAE